MTKCLELWRCMREDRIARVLGGATFAAAWFALTLTSLGVLLTVPLFGAALERRRRHLLRTGALDEDELDDLF